MPYLAEPMYQLVRMTQAFGLLLVVCGLALGGMAGVGWARSVLDGSAMVEIGVSLALSFLLPGLLLLVAGVQMARVRLWAYVATIVVSAFELFKLFMALFVLRATGETRDWYEGATSRWLGPYACNWVLRAPLMILVVRCLLALPEVRDIIRARRRAVDVNRGFEPVMPKLPDKGTVPPRPGRAHQRPRVTDRPAGNPRPNGRSS